MLGERENWVAASLIFPSVSCSRGAASVYDLIEDENCLHEEAGVGEKFGEPGAQFPRRLPARLPSAPLPGA